jgi:hypothetical protein
MKIQYVESQSADVSQKNPEWKETHDFAIYAKYIDFTELLGIWVKCTVY